MAAYAALVSLRHTINYIHHHPSPPISLDKKQVGSLIGNLIFLQDYLENYSGSKDSDALEIRIADAAHAAEDIIESHIVHRIQPHGESSDPFGDLYHGLQTAIRGLDSIKREMQMEIKEEKTVARGISCSSVDAISGLVRSPRMVGFDHVSIEVIDKLTNREPNRRIITVVGMGGIGKTTLADSIYVNPIIVQHFDIRCWAKISPDYCIRHMLLQLVLSIETKGDEDFLSGMSEDGLGEKLRKSLFGRRYFVVMDDMWDIDAWDGMQRFFPNNNNGSRILVTTRLSNVASQLSHDRIEMSLLDENESWNLLCETVFGRNGSCPLELEEIGKRIAENCKGLPLSIVVIGGFLAKSHKTREHWEYVAGDLHSIVNLEDNEICLKILHMSYNQLPVHLKPCFLHMGVFPEGHKINVSSLVKLWVSEGFLKPISRKTMETVARDYLDELISRNLVSIHKFGSSGNIKMCTMHDLLREMCLSVAHKERFLNVIHPGDIPADPSNKRRICFPQSTPPYSFHTYYSGEPEIPNPEACALLSSSNIRSLICNSPVLVSFLNSRLMRVFEAVDPLQASHLSSLTGIFNLVNSRYIGIRVNWHMITIDPSLSLLWNLQTLIFEGPTVIAPSEIWNVSRLRHLKFRKLKLPDPPQGNDGIVLDNLQSLSTVIDFKCSQKVVRRIPKIKKLKLIASDHYTNHSLNNIQLLNTLESLCCTFVFPIHVLTEQIRSEVFSQRFMFPIRLKKLTLLGSRLHWGDMVKIGSLQQLQVLKLKRMAFVGNEWEMVEGQFESLRFFLIEECFDLEDWRMAGDGGAYFPKLEELVLRRLDKLKEVPLEIGEIATLKSIELEYCSDSAVASGRKIMEEQEELGNVDIQLRVRVQTWEANI